MYWVTLNLLKEYFLLKKSKLKFSAIYKNIKAT